MKRVGVVLVLLGVLAFIFGGIRYSREKTVLDLGPIQATATEHHEIPISPIVGAVALIGGLLMLLAPVRRPA